MWGCRRISPRSGIILTFQSNNKGELLPEQWLRASLAARSRHPWPHHLVFSIPVHLIHYSLLATPRKYDNHLPPTHPSCITYKLWLTFGGMRYATAVVSVQIKKRDGTFFRGCFYAWSICLARSTISSIYTRREITFYTHVTATCGTFTKPN